MTAPLPTRMVAKPWGKAVLPAPFIAPPGEVIGEAGLLSDSALPADFSAKTFCTLYRIEKADLKPCLDARHDISEAIQALLDYRLHSAQAGTEFVLKGSRGQRTMGSKAAEVGAAGRSTGDVPCQRALRR